MAGAMVKSDIRGSVLFQTSGTFKWKCPEGVTKVSIALVGSGGSGYWENRQIGAGGNVRFVNDVPVVPGTEYNITIPSQRAAKNLNADNSTSALGYTANSTLSATVLGGNGQQPLQSLGSSMRAGGAVGYVASGTTGQGINLLTFTATAPSSGGRYDGQTAGGGGGYNGSSAGLGAVGAVRILWGKGRAFPSTDIVD
ncbi:hypothetical protein PA10_00190 [Pseudomonas phage pPa_SNUABM_DT01]|nr:hypothetical protein PA10_00190 [Pseudomonas phage pPa_SNUABM_DT01]